MSNTNQQVAPSSKFKVVFIYLFDSGQRPERKLLDGRSPIRIAFVPIEAKMMVFRQTIGESRCAEGWK